MIVPDHIGCGLSDKPDDSRYDYTLASRVDDLEALLDHLGLDRDLTLVLHDWGGMIGMALRGAASRSGSRGWSSATRRRSTSRRRKPFPWALSICRDSPLGGLAGPRAEPVRPGHGLDRLQDAPRCRAIVRDAYAAPYDSWAHRIAIHRFVQDIPLRPGDRSYELISWVQDRLPLLRSMPMLIVWGMKDFVFDRHFLDEWVRRFPAAEVHRFPRAGHLLFEDEREAVNGLVRSFLAAHPLVREPVG